MAMESSPIAAAIARRIVDDEARADVFGLFAVLWQVKHELPRLSAAEVKGVAVAAIAEAMRKGTLVPGEFVDQGAKQEAFVPWRLSREDAIAQIEACCDLARDRDIVWFAPPRLLPLVVTKHMTLEGFHP